ncbi:IS110 family transposase [Actinoplanes sp. NPDC023936]|uniref:IS110 family transposase n=1 Tax=Actinoplanes sp. NPDC023936 TaxID=3154910 RepID=UPI00340E204E
MTSTIMPQSLRPGDEVVLGIDTHRDQHVAAVTDGLGTVLSTRSFAAASAGYQQLLSWTRQHGTVHRAGVEGSGSYGAGISQTLQAAGVTVYDVNRPDRATRRRTGKNDTIDAIAAAHAVITGRATAIAKTGDGTVEQLRHYKIAKDSATKARTQAINQLKAVLVTAGPALRESLTGVGTLALITRCAQLDDTTSAAGYTLRLLARRIKHLDSEIKELTARITTQITATAPDLLAEHGVGPDSAATLLITCGDNPDRITSEAAFAALCGVSPVEMSSGRKQRHRLNRGGDRQANAALYRIILTRLRSHEQTRAYQQKRTTKGHTNRDTIRRLKRYLARHLFTIIKKAFPQATAPLNT